MCECEGVHECMSVKGVHVVVGQGLLSRDGPVSL